MKIKNVRLLSLVFLVLVSLALIIYPTFSGGAGVIVTSAGDNTPCKDVITVGSTITDIAGRSIRNRDDFVQTTKNLKGPITLIINDNPRSCTIPETSTLNVTVKNMGKAGIKFGLDIGGGSLFLFKPKESVSQEVVEKTVEVLKSRMKVYDLSNSKVEDVEDDLIKIIMGLEEERYLNLLTERGILEAGLTQRAELKDRRGEFKFNDKTYEVVLKNDETLSVNGSEHTLNQRFVLDDIEFEVRNISRNTTTFFVKIFDGGDLTVQEETQTAGSKRIIKQGGGYVYVIPVSVSEDGSKKFAKATKGQEMIIDPGSGESFLQEPLVFFIDEILIADLPISGSDIGKEIDNLIIWEFKSTMEETTSDMKRFESVLEVKRLPTSLVLVKTGTYSPTLDDSLITLPLYTILITTVVASILFFIRYRKRGVMILPLILLSFCGIVLVFGVLSLQWFAILIFLFGVSFVLINGEAREWISWLSLFLMFIMVAGIVMSKWVFDFSSIIGLMAAIIFGVCQGGIVGDQFLTGKKVYTQAEYKHSLHRVWILTTIVVLVLTILLFVGGSFRSFAMATIIGVLTSTTITTPLYSNLIEKVSK